MVTQEEEFFKIRREVEENGLEHAKERIAEYHKRLYALDLEGEVNFYAQDRDGIPIAKAHTKSGDDTYICAMLLRNGLDKATWKGVKRPQNWKGCAWPPVRPNDLVGCRSVDELCAECEGDIWYDGTRTDDANYSSWILRKRDYWYENIMIRLHPRVGFGLFARQLIPKGTYLGEYTGMLTPYFGKEDSESDYSMNMECGPLKFGANRAQYTCRVDGARQGSIFRFLNHSCNPSARMVQMRCGLHNRINVVVTTRAIRPDKPITIFYGDDWFDDENPCRCGSQICQTKLKKERKSRSKSPVANRSKTTEHDRVMKKERVQHAKDHHRKPKRYIRLNESSDAGDVNRKV